MGAYPCPDMLSWALNFRVKVPRVGFLINQNPNEVLDPEHKNRLPSIVWWHLVRLAYEEFTKKHNPIAFENFK